jgi:hypothetical protein
MITKIFGGYFVPDISEPLNISTGTTQIKLECLGVGLEYKNSLVFRIRPQELRILAQKQSIKFRINGKESQISFEIPEKKQNSIKNFYNICGVS